jgi:hypothetical protein
MRGETRGWTQRVSRGSLKKGKHNAPGNIINLLWIYVDFIIWYYFIIIFNVIQQLNVINACLKDWKYIKNSTDCINFLKYNLFHALKIMQYPYTKCKH